MMKSIFSEPRLQGNMQSNNTLHDLVQLGLMGSMWTFGTILAHIKTHPAIIYLVKLDTVNDLIFHILQYTSFILTMGVAVINLRKGIKEWEREREEKKINRNK